jgi:glycerol uptake facilitator-like aquaporin
MTLSLPRRMAAELTGTGLLVTAVVGSGIAASRLSPHDVGLELLENAVATGLALAALILMFAPVSGAHFNPVVSVADWWLHRRDPGGITARTVAAYTVAQTGGAIVGAILANVMFDAPTVAWSVTSRTGSRLWLSEVVATAGLILLIFALARTGRGSVVPAAVGSYIAAAYWFTSSTSFANPAVTIGRMFSNTFAGISPASVPGFIVAQIIGLALAVAAVAVWYPRATRRQPATAARADEHAPTVPIGAPR